MTLPTEKSAMTEGKYFHLFIDFSVFFLIQLESFRSTPFEINPFLSTIFNSPQLQQQLFLTQLLLSGKFDRFTFDDEIR